MSIDVTTPTAATPTTVPLRATASKVGDRVRTIAVACVVVFWGLLTAMMLAVPDAMHSPVLWSLLAVVTGTAMLVFAVAPLAERAGRHTT